MIYFGKLFGEISYCFGTSLPAGGHELYNGFRGCLRSLFVAQRIVDLNKLLLDSANSVVAATIGTCGIRDR